LFPPDLLCDTASDFGIVTHQLDHEGFHTLSVGSSALSLLERLFQSTPPWDMEDTEDDSAADSDASETEHDVDSYENLDSTAFESDCDDHDVWPNWDTWDGVEMFKNWPQENEKYYVKARRKYGKSYVRTDKYDLEKMISYFQADETNEDSDEDSAVAENTLPSMESAYGANYG